MKFVLEINLDNAAMETPQDISLALKKVADKVNCFESTDYMVAIYSIKDANGNSVGFFGRQDSDD